MRAIALTAAVALSACIAAGCSTGEQSSRSQGAELTVSLLDEDPDISEFYKRRRFKPLWLTNQGITPEAEQLLEVLRRSERDGLMPSSYLTTDLMAAVASARGGDGKRLARLDPLLTQAFASYIRDLHIAVPSEAMVYVDPELKPQPRSSLQLLEAAAASSSLRTFIVGAARMNPVYEALRDELEKEQKKGSDAQAAQLIRANLERARAIPANPGPRFILVDTAGAQLRLFENGQVTGTMKVIVGEPAMQTPAMAGVIRFVVLNPYWNVPRDLVRDKIAPKVRRLGVSYLANERFQALSDFTKTAVPVDPTAVDWHAVEAGLRPQKVRQLPGRDNMMGAVKFMFPNRLGIYLHDTPDKLSFHRENRMRSSGCVRVEDAQKLSRWLFGGEIPATGQPEQRVDLPRPVPVFIAYLTAVPSARGIVLQPDTYRRDDKLLAAIARQTQQQVKAAKRT